MDTSRVRVHGRERDQDENRSEENDWNILNGWNYWNFFQATFAGHITKRYCPLNAKPEGCHG
jgi:hypothetical protein